jgi:hypothetical protein
VWGIVGAAGGSPEELAIKGMFRGISLLNPARATSRPKMMFFTVEIRTVNATFYVVKFVSYERG